MKLIHKKTGKEVQIGDKVKSFRGESFKVKRITKPLHGGSTGRVDVEAKDGFGGSFYPSVVNCEWIEREDQ
jgi:hypothetical protein